MEFGHNGGTIGRSLESDWVLPDGQRYLSSRHASIDFRSGSYYVVDTSTNGVYVNDGEQPVGRGNPQRLFTGDRIRIGEYEMSVEITDEDDTRETLTDDRHVDPVSKAQRVPPPDPTRADMVAPHEITAVGIEMLISEEVEIGQIQRMNKANAASLRLEEDAPRAPGETESRAAARGAAHRARTRGRRPEAPGAAARQRGYARHPRGPAATALPPRAPRRRRRPYQSQLLRAAASRRRDAGVARRVLPRRRPTGPTARRQASRAGAASLGAAHA